MKLLLASQSTRRSELLKSLGYKFNIVNVSCEEQYPKTLEVQNVAAFLAKLKAEAFRQLEESEVLITADTIVTLGNEILEKPKDELQAFMMLKKLSGKIHQVYTAICIKTCTNLLVETDVTEVEFEPLTNEEIQDYIQKFKPYDKAGAYGIQEWIGMAKIRSIKGSFYTVMGLPTHLVYHHLKAIYNQNT